MKNEFAKLDKNPKHIRTGKGILHGDIVQTLDGGQSFISNIENGKMNPTLATITKLAKAVGVSVN